MTERAEPIIDAVVIGRNEGPRLQACLLTLQGKVRRIIYVDSGSDDGSIELAQALGAEVIALDMSHPFTAARARNVGLRQLADDPPAFVQMLDGDCQMQAGWIAAASDWYCSHPQAVVVCGRRSERFPELSIYNRMADIEWNTPVGQATACGGDALMRFSALQAAGGYRDDLIAGEEPELCLRLIRAGGEVWRIDAEMTLHDAAMLRFGQWWRRTVRAGHAFAEGAALHGAGPERHWVAERRRALVWGLAIPVVGMLLAVFVPWGGAVFLAYPLQVLRLSSRGDPQRAVFSVLGKFAEVQGILGYWMGRAIGAKPRLIEYK